VQIPAIAVDSPLTGLGLQHDGTMQTPPAGFPAGWYTGAPTIALAGHDRSARRLAYLACTLELTGVVTVGTLSVLDPGAFPDPSVWSGYGSGYGFVPAVLPILGLLWLRHTRHPHRVATGHCPDPVAINDRPVRVEPKVVPYAEGAAQHPPPPRAACVCAGAGVPSPAREKAR